MGNAPGTIATGIGDVRELVADDDGGRLDATVAAAWPDLSRARVQRLIEAGHVTVNGEPARKSGRLSPGDRVAVTVPDAPHEPAPVDFDLPLLFEDDALLAIAKPPGLAVHGATGDLGPSIAGWFVARYPTEAAAFDAERPGIVHRLDKDTSGVLLMAKTPAAQAAISSAFEARETRKLYVAVCDAVPAKPRAVIDAPIGRHQVDRMRQVINDQGRSAQTEYEVIGTAGHRALLQVRLITGRTHQARVHLTAIGAPITGDGVYGRTPPPADSAGMRQLLHAWQITVPHPSGGTLTVTAPLAPDYREAVRLLGFETIASPYTVPTPAALSDA